MKSLKYKVLFGGILCIIFLSMAFLGKQETHFQNIDNNINVLSLTVTIYPEGYGSSDWEETNPERPVNHFVDLSKNDPEFLKIFSILSPYSYEEHENSVKTKGRNFENSQEARIILSITTVNRIFGIPFVGDTIFLSDLGDMNVNKRTYKMNGDSAQGLLQELLLYLDENPHIVYTA